MTKRRENKLFRKKRREWDKTMAPIDKWVAELGKFIDKMVKETKYNLNNWLDFYFGDSKDRDEVHKLLRRIAIAVIDFFILKALNII